ncbi:MAG: hypothetical protein ICV64_06955 [Thermoleophilia bacterium]|nr:hypothetical protein [Thermoleophilia bacterium]
MSRSATPDLPTGTVTFLFTDIEGSTQLVRRLGARYGDTLAEHQRLLRSAFDAHGGREIDTQGDSFFVAFARATDAVLAAVDGQRALGAHGWPDGIRPRARMGIHTGQAAIRDQGYLGLAVHRAARICAAAHGDQIVLSQTTKALLEDEEEVSLPTRDLGEQRLKDFDRPVRLHQVEHPELPSDFPPLRTVEAASVPPLAGREAELADAAARVVARPRPRRRRIVVPLAAAALVLAGVATAVLSRNGAGLRADPNTVALISVGEGAVVDTVPVGPQRFVGPTLATGAVTFGAGAAWVANRGHTVSRIDGRTKAATPVGVDGEVFDLAADARGVWAAHQTGGLSKIAASGEAGEAFQVPAGDGSYSVGAVAVAGGAVWLAGSTPEGLDLVRLDPATRAPDGVVRLGRRTATSLAVGHGSAWLASTLTNEVVRVSLTSRAVHPISVAAPGAIAVAPSGVWVASEADDRVWWIDPATNLLDDRIQVGDAPVDIAVGEGAVWVANYRDGSVSRIDPKRREVTDTIPVGPNVAALAAGDGFVWAVVAPPRR